MNFVHKRATAWFFGLAIFTTLLCWGLVNDNWSQAPESLRLFSTYDWAAMIEDSGEYDSFSEEKQQFLVSILVSQSKFLELSLTAGWVAWSCGYLALSGLDRMLPKKEEA